MKLVFLIGHTTWEICFNQSEALPIWVVTRHQCGISAVVPQTSFGGKPVLASWKVGCFHRLVPIANLNTRLQPWILARDGRGYPISVLCGIRVLYPLNCKLEQLSLCYNSPFSLMSAVYGTTSVYPSRGFDPGAVLTAIQQERLEFSSFYFNEHFQENVSKKFQLLFLKTWKQAALQESSGRKLFNKFLHMFRNKRKKLL